jgi:hypothetical protein
MSVFSKIAAAMIVAAGTTVAAQAGAVTLAPVAGLHDRDASAIQDIRWEQRCHREMVRGSDRFGRRTEVPRRVCQRIWVGPRR